MPGILNYDLYVSGHIHEPLGIHTFGAGPKSCVFANTGSILRTSRDIANYARQVQVLLVTHESGGLLGYQELPLDVMAPALEVFGRRPSKDSPDVSSDDITSFIDKLGQGLRADTLSSPELLSEMGMIRPQVKAEVTRHLEEAQV